VHANSRLESNKEEEEEGFRVWESRHLILPLPWFARAPHTRTRFLLFFVLLLAATAERKSSGLVKVNTSFTDRSSPHLNACCAFFLLLFLCFSFFFTLVTGPRRSLSLKLSDTRVYEPQIRARLW